MNKQRVKSRGLGDDLKKLTYITGIATVAKKVTNALGIEDCGCDKRQEKLNELFPYKK